jgi:hypothetical protein
LCAAPVVLAGAAFFPAAALVAAAFFAAGGAAAFARDGLLAASLAVFLRAAGDAEVAFAGVATALPSVAGPTLVRRFRGAGRRRDLIRRRGTI